MSGAESLVRDEDLLRRTQDGDVEAATMLYRRYSGPVHAYALSLTKDPAQSQDVVQEAFLRLLTTVPAKPLASLRALLFTIARNIALDARRKDSLRRKKEVLIPASPGESRPKDTGWAEEISQALSQLGTDEREIVVLKIYGDLILSDIAQLLEIPLGTVASRYRSALERLAGLLSVENL
jgi:RNA polymerase sigma-70 factor (ECF subfamily)